MQQIRKDYCDGFQFLANTVKVSIPNEESNKPMDIEVYKQKIRQQISLTESTGVKYIVIPSSVLQNKTQIKIVSLVSSRCLGTMYGRYHT